MLVPVRTVEQQALVRLASGLQKNSADRRAILGFLTRIARITFEPFQRGDWYGMSGASSFADGTPPYIAYFGGLKSVPFLNAKGEPDLEYNSGMIVVDANGISVHYLNENGEGVQYNTPKGVNDPQQALQIAELVAKKVQIGKLPQGMRVSFDDRPDR